MEKREKEEREEERATSPKGHRHDSRTSYAESKEEKKKIIKR